MKHKSLEYFRTAELQLLGLIENETNILKTSPQTPLQVENRRKTDWILCHMPSGPESTPCSMIFISIEVINESALTVVEEPSLADS